MEYNWADPRKNSLIGNLMMAKTEASRMKRLTSVKSTVSNQLNPSIEHKLKQSKKKKTNDTLDGRPSSRLHQRPFDSDTSSLSNNNSSTHSSGRSTASFYNEFLPVAAKLPDVFDSIDVHAAADGLFHPASDVQAFAEHDSKYPVRGLASRGADTNTNANANDRRLPPLSGKSDRSERLTSRSDARLPTVNANAVGHRSETDLHAPRRIGLVPSSADRDAIELAGHLDANTNQRHPDNQPSPCQLKTKPTRRTASITPNANKKPIKAKPSVMPPLELDLTKKFESLKELLKTNREKKSVSASVSTSASANSPGPEVDDEAETTPISDPVKPTHEKLAPTPENNKPTDKKKTKTRTTTTGGAELKHRNGVSLTDLKDEHRAALALLQELGGSMETDYQEAKPATKKSAISKKSTRGRMIKAPETTPTIVPTQPAGSATRLVERLRSSTLSGRLEEHQTVGANANQAQGSKELAAVALDAARQALDAGSPTIARITPTVADAAKDEELWNRYAGDQPPEDDEDDEDPSAELYDDEPFES